MVTSFVLCFAILATSWCSLSAFKVPKGTRIVFMPTYSTTWVRTDDGGINIHVDVRSQHTHVDAYGRLTVDILQPSQAGTYTWKLYDTFRGYEWDPVKFPVVEMDQTEESCDVTLQAGDNRDLVCRLPGEGTVWLNENDKVIGHGVVFSIRNASEADSALYLCSVGNLGQVFNVTVKEPLTPTTSQPKVEPITSAPQSDDEKNAEEQEAVKTTGHTKIITTSPAESKSAAGNSCQQGSLSSAAAAVACIMCAVIGIVAGALGYHCCMGMTLCSSDDDIPEEEKSLKSEYFRTTYTDFSPRATLNSSKANILMLGFGDSGKSSFCSTLRRALGENSTWVENDTAAQTKKVCTFEVGKFLFYKAELVKDADLTTDKRLVEDILAGMTCIPKPSVTGQVYGKQDSLSRGQMHAMIIVATSSSINGMSQSDQKRFTELSRFARNRGLVTMAILTKVDDLDPEGSPIEIYKYNAFKSVRKTWSEILKIDIEDVRAMSNYQRYKDNNVNRTDRIALDVMHHLITRLENSKLN